MQILNIPKVQLSVILLVIYLSAWVNSPDLGKVYLLLGSVGFCVVWDLVFTYIRKRQLFVPWAAITTGLIISLTSDLQVGWLALAVICAGAMASKNFLRISGRHVFNPAGFGLLAGGLVFALPVAWWGVSFQSLLDINLSSLLPFLILISPALVSAYRMKRFVGILTFLAVYTLISQSLNSFLDPTVLFFSLVMLPEPMTSPVNYKRQALYGILVGVLAFLLPTFQPIAALLPDVLIPALLLGNLVFFKFR